MLFTKDEMAHLNTQFQRIFTLPLTKTSFRELQNSVMITANGDTQKANTFLETLMTHGEKGDAKGTEMKSFIDQFCVPTRVAKEVHDRGEILSMLTSDIGVQGENVLFSTRVRRVDGQEFHYLSDTEGFLSVMDHCVSRLHDAKQTEIGQKNIETHKERLKLLQDKLAQITA